MMDSKKEYFISAITLSAVIASLTFSYKSLKGYSSSSECIVESMKNTSSDRAATYIKQACADMFGGELKVPSKKLSIDKVTLLNGKAFLSEIYPHNFNITVYNGNDDTTITGLYININYTEKTGANNSRRYFQKVKILPLSMSTVYFEIDKPTGEYTWTISGADGYQTAKQYGQIDTNIFNASPARIKINILKLS